MLFLKYMWPRKLLLVLRIWSRKTMWWIRICGENNKGDVKQGSLTRGHVCLLLSKGLRKGEERHYVGLLRVDCVWQSELPQVDFVQKNTCKSGLCAVCGWVLWCYSALSSANWGTKELAESRNFSVFEEDGICSRKALKQRGKHPGSTAPRIQHSVTADGLKPRPWPFSLKKQQTGGFKSPNTSLGCFSLVF